MQKISAITIGVAGPALFFAVVLAGSSSLYTTTSVPVAASRPSIDTAAPAEAAEPAPAEETADADPEPEAEDRDQTEAAAEEVAEAGEEPPVTEESVADGEPAADGEPDADRVQAAVTEPGADAEPAAEAAADTEAPEALEETAAALAEVEPEPEAAPGAGDDLAKIAAAGDVRAGARIWRQCSACHVADQEQNRVGPHLVGIIGRTVASVDGFNYSDALTGLSGAWTVADIDAWVGNPSEYAPGNRMSFRGVRDEEDRANLLAFLADLQLQQ